MEDLPAELTIDILSRLPVKTIFHCKRVCKKWRNLVSDSSFVNLHISRSPTGIIIHNKPDRNKYVSVDPGILKWVEIEDKVDHHNLHHDPLMSLDLNLAPILQNSGISQMGSVNGLIGLYQYFFGPKPDNAYICNPITREYMILPRQRYYKESALVMVYGFGVSSLTGEHKVVRTFQGDVLTNGVKPSRRSVIEAEVYTLDTGQWRSLGRVPYLFNGFYGLYGPFLNDHCHWIVDDPVDAPQKLCTFDLDKETFQLFPSPPTESVQVNRIDYQGLAVLKGCLCKFETYDSELVIWVMKEYGIKKSWHKEVMITQEISVDIEWPLFEFMFLIESLKDGSIVVVFEDKLWAFYPQSGTTEDTKMFGTDLSGLAYRPSFLKLQNFEPERVQMF